MDIERSRLDINNTRSFDFTRIYYQILDNIGEYL